MKAYLIDPEAKTVTEVTYSGDYHEIYTHIGATTFDAVRFHDENDDTAYVDDEGLLKGPSHFFMFKGDGHQPLAGKALILGTDEEGDSVAPKITLEELTAMVEFGEPVNSNLGLFWMPADGGRMRPIR